MESIRRLLPELKSDKVLESIEDTLVKLKEEKDQIPCYLDLNNSKCAIRKKIIDWIIIVNKKLSISDISFYIQVDIIDTFFEKIYFDLETDDFHLLAITAIRLASKYHEIHSISMPLTVKNICHNRFNKEDLIIYEILVLKTLKYRVKYNNFKDFVFLVIEIFYKNNNRYKFEEYFDFIYKLCIFNYKFYRKLSKINLFLAITFFCLEKFKNENKLAYDSRKFYELVKYFDYDFPELIKISKKIILLKEKFNDDDYEYFKHPIL